MSTITIKECNLCDTRSSVEETFEHIGDIDVCRHCLDVLGRAVQHNLIIFSPFWKVK